MAEGSKAEQRFTHVTFAAAKRQLHALVRKYNQASTNALGFQLHIAIDQQEEPHIISYTLILKNSSSWEIRRVTSTLLVDPQLDFVRTVKQMDMKLGEIQVNLQSTHSNVNCK